MRKTNSGNKLHSRPLPSDFSFQALFSPNLEYVYFDQAEAVPFVATADAFRIENAWWCAEASYLAYVRDEAFVANVLAKVGFAEVQMFDRGGTQGYLTVNDDLVLVAFRGTERHELSDIIADLKIGMAPMNGRGKVHLGFKEALDRVWDDLHQMLLSLLRERPSRPVWFAGHSLGGALAVLAGARFPAARGVFTFGCPRIGNWTFRQLYPVSCYRVVNNNDFIALLPPPLFYRHVGELHYINARGRLTRKPGWRRKLTDGLRGAYWHLQWILREKGWRLYDQVILDHVADHAPAFYATHLWNELVRRYGRE